MADIPKGTRVQYHGSIANMHGEYTVAYRCDCDRCEGVFDEAWDVLYWSTASRHRATLDTSHLNRYVLTEDGHYETLTCVRAESITVIAEINA